MAVPAPIPTPDLTRFNQLIKQNELNQQVANQLYQVLSTCEIVMLCDDSSSMSKCLAEEGTDPFAPKRTTRWLELKRLAAGLIDFVTSINPAGLDIYFLNRPMIKGVTNIAGLQSTFNTPPDGGTPLIGALNRIYYDKRDIPSNKNLLIIVISDGEPTDGSRSDLYNTLVNKRNNVHISFTECTDNAEDMEYLDAWDGLIRNFDNTEDYREELARIKNIQGNQFKYDFTDHIVRILLCTFLRWYFNLDQVKVSQNVSLPSPIQQFQPPPAQVYQQPPPQQFQQPPPQPYQTPVVVATQTTTTYPATAPPPRQEQYQTPVAVATQTTTTYPATAPPSYPPPSYPRKKKSDCVIV